MNPFTSMLLVPTTIWDLESSLFNAADVFDLGDNISIVRDWLAEAIPTQDQLVNAVQEYLPTWAEIYAIYVNSGDLIFANQVFDYYSDNLDPDKEFGLHVSLYALRDYSFTKTVELGTPHTYYEIAKKTDDGWDWYDDEFDEEEMEEMLKARFEEEWKEVDDVWTFVGFIVDAIIEGVVSFLGALWGDIVTKLSDLWYQVSTTFKEFIYSKFPLSLASKRSWAIAVTKGTTFDDMRQWDYSVETKTSVETIEDAPAHEQFSDDVEMTQINGHPIKSNDSEVNSSNEVVSKTTIFKNSGTKVLQVLEYEDITKEVTSWHEYLKINSTNILDYIVERDRPGDNGSYEIDCDNRLAYVVEKLAQDPTKLRYDINEFSAAYEAVRAYKGISYMYTGMYADYSALLDGAVGYPLENVGSVSITSCAGPRVDPIDGIIKTHGAMDLGAPEGTKILAVKEGRVLYNQIDPDGYGNYIVLDHGDGWYTLYAHMVRPSPLSVGTQVRAGQIIGYVGTTGRSTGEHLHIELRYGTSGFWSAERLEPLLYMDMSTIPEALPSTSGCPDRDEWGLYVEDETEDEEETVEEQ